MVAYPLPPGKKGRVRKQNLTCAMKQFAGRGSDFSIKFPVRRCDAYVTVQSGSRLGAVQPTRFHLDGLSDQLISEALWQWSQSGNARGGSPQIPMSGHEHGRESDDQLDKVGLTGGAGLFEQPANMGLDR